MGFRHKSMILRDGGGGVMFDEYMDVESVILTNEQEFFQPRPQRISNKKVTKNITNNTLNIFAGALPKFLKGVLSSNGNSNNNSGKPRKKQIASASGKKSVPNYVKSKMDDYIAKQAKRNCVFEKNNYEVPGEVEVITRDVKTGKKIYKTFHY